MNKEITTRPFKWRDGLKLIEDPNEKGLKGQKDIEKWLKLNESEGPAYTAIRDGEIVACGGVRIYWKGCGEAWALFGKVKGSRHEVQLLGKSILQKIIEEHDLVRVEATPRTDWALGLNYLHWLGFKVESKKRKYLPDNEAGLVDAYVVVIIKED